MDGMKCVKNETFLISGLHVCEGTQKEAQVFNISRNLQMLRKINHFAQEEIADKLGVARRDAL